MQSISQRRQCPSTRQYGVTVYTTVIISANRCKKLEETKIVLIMPPKRFNINIETYRDGRFLNARVHVPCMTWRTALRWREVSSGSSGVLLLVADFSSCVLAHSVISRKLNVEHVLCVYITNYLHFFTMFLSF